eukprot:TRINITY_DN63567_c0_g1_i1.p1 TRINITY_DN63567_c0_g1~~TRINITY_DN63567_c0_g1_i1.p1  ORF type:complete len:578 (+),score=82.52 TRINITY_DN63567_c0_g1_i1:87-1736(+)
MSACASEGAAHSMELFATVPQLPVFGLNMDTPNHAHAFGTVGNTMVGNANVTRPGCRRFCCPAGHGLQHYVTPIEGFTCDCCGEVLPQGVGTEFCRTCNFDICAKCVASGKTPPSPGLSAQSPTGFGPLPAAPTLPVLQPSLGLTPFFLTQPVLPPIQLPWENGAATARNAVSDVGTSGCDVLTEQGLCSLSSGNPTVSPTQWEFKKLSPRGDGSVDFAAKSGLDHAKPHDVEQRNNSPLPMQLPHVEPVSYEGEASRPLHEAQSFLASILTAGSLLRHGSGQAEMLDEEGKHEVALAPEAASASSRSVSRVRKNPLLSVETAHAATRLVASRSPAKRRSRRTLSSSELDPPPGKVVEVVPSPTMQSRTLAPLNGCMPHFPAEELLSPSEKGPRCPRRHSPKDAGRASAAELCSSPGMAVAASALPTVESNDISFEFSTAAPPCELPSRAATASAASANIVGYACPKDEQDAQFCSILFAALADAAVNAAVTHEIGHTNELGRTTLTGTAFGPNHDAEISATARLDADFTGVAAAPTLFLSASPMVSCC